MALTLPGRNSSTFRLTDGMTVYDFLAKGSPLKLASWNPAMSQSKNGGVMINSPIVDGQRLAAYALDSTIETIELAIGVDGNKATAVIRGLKNLLKQAQDFWAGDPAALPVWLESKSAGETSIRYAKVLAYKVDENSMPFANCKSPRILTVAILREHWTSNRPGEADCVNIRSQRVETELIKHTVEISAVEADKHACTFDESGYFSNTGNNLVVGVNFPYDAGMAILFPALAIPRDAYIVDAYLEIYANSSDSSTVCVASMTIEDVNSARPITSWADMMSRNRVMYTSPNAHLTGNKEAYWTIPTTTSGAVLRSPNLSGLIQMVVNRGGWVSGNSIQLFFDEFDSTNSSIRHFAAWTYTAPKLTVRYVQKDNTGYESSIKLPNCDGDTYIANFHNAFEGITHVYHHSVGGGWSANLVDDVPYALFPDPAYLGDCIYFGNYSIHPVADGGSTYKFFNLMFDVSQVWTTPEQGQIKWEYYGADTNWYEMPITDTTDDFHKLGLGSVHWDELTAMLWWTHDPGMGVDAFWIRARYTMADEIVETHTHGVPQSQIKAYTQAVPYIEVLGEDLGGDLNAVCTLELENISDQQGPGGSYPTGYPQLFSNRVLLGTRSMSRGSAFTAFLNTSENKQDYEASGVVPTLMSNSTFFDGSPTHGSSIQWATAAAADRASMLSRMRWDFTYNTYRLYSGTYHAFVRCSAFDYADEVTMAMRLAIKTGRGNGYVYSDVVYPSGRGVDWETLDFGRLDIGVGSFAGLTPNGTAIELQVSTENTNAILDIYDLVLVPVDEWAGDFIDVEANENSALSKDKTLLVDSNRDVLTHLRALTLHKGLYAEAVWQVGGNGRMALKPGVDQRIWLLSMRKYVSSYNGVDITMDVSVPAVTFRAKLYASRQYWGARGVE